MLRTSVLSATVLLLTSALAHGQTNSIADGNWASPSTWDNGVPGAFTPATVTNALTIDSASACNDAFIESGGSVDISSNLDVGLTFQLREGSAQLQAGQLSAWILSIGTATDETGTFTVNGGSLDLQFFGGLGPAALLVIDGSLAVEGGDGSLVVGSGGGGEATFEEKGHLVARPTTNGPSGLSALQIAGPLTIEVGSTLVLDTSLHSPAVGDSWTVVQYTGPMTGTFDLVTGPDYTAVLDSSVPGVITLTVTGVPQAVPATGNTGAFALFALLLMLGVRFLPSVRQR